MRSIGLFSELTIDDLPENSAAIAQSIGLPNLILLSQSHGGTAVYIPQSYELLRNLIYRKILAEYDGGNIRELAVKYGVSESTVYNVVREDLIARRRAPLEGQVGLW
jgi:Mor family transcriptional regulator